jgi:gamma-glutamyltranspeptidase/glutathione hydrolase
VEGDRNIHGPLSFVIPSAVAGYALLHERYGRLPLREVLAPAVSLAQARLAGGLVHHAQGGRFRRRAALVPRERARLPARRLAADRALPGHAGLLHPGQPARTLERLASAGLRDFYEGEVAAAVARTCGRWAASCPPPTCGCRARVLPAVEVPWAGRRLMLANGLTAAPTLRRVLEAWKGAVPGAAEPDAEWYARFARAMRAAYAERLSGLGDAEPRAAESCTTHLTACDRDGMMVAMTTTLLSSMGSRVVLPRSGVLMNNGVMWFDPTPGAANAWRPASAR